MKNKLFAYKMTAPTIFALLVMTVYPVIFTLVYSFTDYNYLKRDKKFIGLSNYTALFGNMYFQRSVINTIVFTLLAVALEVVIGLLIALFVNSLGHGKKIVRLLHFQRSLYPLFLCYFFSSSAVSASALRSRY